MLNFRATEPWHCIMIVGNDHQVKNCSGASCMTDLTFGVPRTQESDENVHVALLHDAKFDQNIRNVAPVRRHAGRARRSPLPNATGDASSGQA